MRHSHPIYIKLKYQKEQRVRRGQVTLEELVAYTSVLKLKENFETDQKH